MRCSRGVAIVRRASKRFPAAILTARIHGLSSPRPRHQRRTLTGDPVLDPIKEYDRAPAAEFWPAYLRGEAYVGLKNGPAAAEQFRSILERRGAASTSPLYALAHRGAARAAVLTGDHAAARSLYDQFFTLWSSADARRLMDESRSEYARLQ